MEVGILPPVAMHSFLSDRGRSLYWKSEPKHALWWVGGLTTHHPVWYTRKTGLSGYHNGQVSGHLITTIATAVRGVFTSVCSAWTAGVGPVHTVSGVHLLYCMCLVP